MDSDTRCTGRLVLLLPLLQTSFIPPFPHLPPPAPAAPALAVLVVVAVAAAAVSIAAAAVAVRLCKRPQCTGRDPASFARPTSLLFILASAAASLVLCKVAAGDKRVFVLCDSRRAPCAEQLQPSARRRAQEETVLLPEILPTH